MGKIDDQMSSAYILISLGISSVFIYLKVSHTLDWSWVWVFAPVWLAPILHTFYGGYIVYFHPERFPNENDPMPTTMDPHWVSIGLGLTSLLLALKVDGVLNWGWGLFSCLFGCCQFSQSIGSELKQQPKIN